MSTQSENSSPFLDPISALAILQNNHKTHINDPTQTSPTHLTSLTTPSQPRHSWLKHNWFEEDWWPILTPAGTEPSYLFWFMPPMIIPRLWTADTSTTTTKTNTKSEFDPILFEIPAVWEFYHWDLHYEVVRVTLLASLSVWVCGFMIYGWYWWFNIRGGDDDRGGFIPLVNRFYDENDGHYDDDDCDPSDSDEPYELLVC
jgi:hypothetical protein